MRAIVLALVATSALGFAGCDQDEVATEPWVITGLQFILQEGPKVVLQADYTAPGDRDGQWRYEIAPTVDAAQRFESDPFYNCWKQAQVGSTMPDCMRTFGSN